MLRDSLIPSIIPSIQQKPSSLTLPSLRSFQAKSHFCSSCRKWSLTTSQSASRTCARCELRHKKKCLQKLWTCLLKHLHFCIKTPSPTWFRMVKRFEADPSSASLFRSLCCQGLNLAFIDPVLITQKAWSLVGNRMRSHGFGCGWSNFDKL